MPARLAIHRLSARTPARAQPVAARLALQALGADLEDAVPRGLPPQALLWLRRLRLQAPEAALLRPAPGAWRQDWIAAGREQLDAALAQAARPALGPVPDSTPAVLFADAAEMLACLALAAQRGQLDRWWWRGLLGRAWPQWQPAWAARPEAQAAAQRLLARVGRGRPVGAPWDEPLPAPAAAAPVQLPRAGDVVMAAQRANVAAADACHESTQVLPPARPGAAFAAPHGVSVATPREPHAPAFVPPTAVDGVEARGVSPESPRQPRPRVRERPADPSALQPPPAAPVANARQPEAAAAPAWAPPDGPTPAAPPRAASPRRRTRTAARVAPASVGPEAAPFRAEAPLSAQRDRPPAAPPRSPGGALAGASLRLTPAPSAPGTSAERIDPPAPVPQPPLLPPQPAADAAADTAALWPWPQALTSHQAPLLFIVNALLEDGLYPDFTRPLDPGLPVPPWALLAALAHAWRLSDDPLQAALQQRCPGWAPPCDMPVAPGAPAGPWPAWLAAYARALRRRLCRRLGCRPAAWPQALTLARPARLWLSEAEWVAEFPLDTHDVAWRLAGLDRDPGWLPSAGCSLRFEFV